MGRKLALLIGNAIYDDPAFPTLEKAVPDVENMADVLGNQHIGGFEVQSLINETAETIKHAIEVFFQQAKKDDFLLLYFSGHGHAWNKLQNLYLITKKTQRDSLMTTAISASFLKEAMDLSNAGIQVLILDCCCSGTFVQGMKGGHHLGTAKIAPVFAGRGRVVLTASSGTEPAWQGDETQPLSLFTSYLVQGLATGAADERRTGRITLDEWYEYAFQGVIAENVEQTPSKSILNQQGTIVIAHTPFLAEPLPARPHLPLRYVKKASGRIFSPALFFGGIFTILIGILLGVWLNAGSWFSSTTTNVPTSAACAAPPVLTGAGDGQTLRSRTVTLTWKAPQGCAPDGYTVRLSEFYDPAANPWPEKKPWVVNVRRVSPDFTYTFSGDGTYYWHIQACKPCTPFHPGSWATRSFSIQASSAPSPTSGSHPSVNAYSNYGQSNVVGRSMCLGTPNNPRSIPGGTVSQTFTVPAGVASLSNALIQIDPNPWATAHLSVEANGNIVAIANAVPDADTWFRFGPITVNTGNRITVTISFTATSGKIVTVYTVGNPGGSFTMVNECPDGAANLNLTSSGLRAIISGVG